MSEREESYSCIEVTKNHPYENQTREITEQGGQILCVILTNVFFLL